MMLRLVVATTIGLICLLALGPPGTTVNSDVDQQPQVASAAIAAPVLSAPDIPLLGSTESRPAAILFGTESAEVAPAFTGIGARPQLVCRRVGHEAVAIIYRL